MQPISSAMNLRPYQLAALDAARAHYGAKKRSVLLVAPTGSGKGVVAVAIVTQAIAKGKRCIFSAPRRVIVDDAYRRLERAGMPPSLMGVMMGGDQRKQPSAPCQVACIDTLIRRRIAAPDLVIFDEAHLGIDKQMKLASEWPSTKILGLTATPSRADGRGLGELYQAMVQVAKPSTLISDGWLVDPEGWTVPRERLPDVDRVKIAGDYDLEELEEACDRRELVGSIVDHWRERAGGRRTVVFAVGVKHSRSICDALLASSIRAEHIDASTKDRDQIFGRLESGDAQVLCSVGTLTVGWDMPAVKCCVVARPTVHEALWIQMTGRVLRPWGGVGAVILDHAGNWNRLGAPHADRDYSIEGRKRRIVEAPAPTTCPKCFACFLPGPTMCPRCGAELQSSEAGRKKGPRETDGNLVRAGEALPLGMAKDLASRVWVATQRGFDREWVLDSFERKHGRPVPADLRARHRMLR